MSKSTTILADLVRDVADRLEAASERPFATLGSRDAREVSIQLTAFADAVNAALDGLYALVGFHGAETLPPIAGGAPADAGEWTRPTPLAVLAADAPEPEGPTNEDWADYFAWRDGCDHGLTDADHHIVHGCI